MRCGQPVGHQRREQREEIEYAVTEQALLRDHPIALFRRRVVEASLIPASELDEIDRETVSQVERCVASAKSAPLPTAADLMTDVYVSY